MKKLVTPHQPADYQIKVEGKLAERWLDGLEGVTATFDGEVTTLSCPALDQAALRGILCWLWDLNLVLLSTHRVDPSPNEEG